MGKLVFRGNIKLNADPVSGTGDDLLTRDASTKDVGKIGSGITSLPQNYIFVGDASGVPTAVAVGGVLSNSSGTFSIVDESIVNADISGSAGIALSKLAGVTSSRAIVSTAGGVLTASSVTAAELAYLSGVTSNIQTQLAGKQATITGAASTIVSSDLTANRVAVTNSSGKIAESTITTTKLGYLTDVTTNIGAALGTKLTVNLGATATGDLIWYDGANFTNLGIGAEGEVLTVVSGEPSWETGTSNGLPTGGTTSQYLKKNSGTNYDTVWDTLTVSDITDLTADAGDINLIAGLDGTITNTELSYLAGLTSNLQTQLNNLQSSTLAYGAIWYGNTSNLATQLAPGASSSVLTMVGGVPVWQTPPTPGTFSGPVSSTDNAIVRFNGTAGNAGQNSGVIISDTDGITGATAFELINQGVLTLRELTANGTHYVGLRADDSMAASYTITFPTAAPGNNTYLKYDGADYVWDAGTGVTSVGLSLPAIFSVSGSPVTTTGTLSATLATQTANYVWAGPTSGSAAAPTFRALTSADSPILVIEDVTTTTYNFVAGDYNKIKRFTHASGCTATIPTGLPVGWYTNIYRADGAGTLTIASAGTLESSGTTLSVAKTMATLYVRATDIHVAVGAFGGGGGGASAFTDLTDAPASYTGHGSKVVTVKADESGLEFTTVAGTGTVTSVALSLPAIFSVSGSPVTSSGTLTGTLATQSANRVWAGPTSGGAATPTFRALVASDIPDISSTYYLASNPSGYITDAAADLGYTPEDAANKSTDGTFASPSSTTYPTTQATKTYVDTKSAKIIQFAATPETTAFTTGTNKVSFRMPYAMTLTAVRASLSTAQSSGSILTIDINEGGTSILSTKLTIDNGEKTSTTAATPAVISDTSLADDAEITVDVDQVGNGTATGLKITLIGV